MGNPSYGATIGPSVTLSTARYADLTGQPRSGMIVPLMSSQAYCETVPQFHVALIGDMQLEVFA